MMKIVFLGTPDFAVASLQALIEHQYDVVAVVTAPDKPAGRGMQLQMSAVKKYALTQNIPVLQPEKLKNEDFLKELKGYQADLQIVVAFRMLPEVVWNMPPMGTINVHGSLLPDYRGAAPIHWAVMNGEKETGVTTFKLKHQIDTGNILLQHRIRIGENDTTGTIYSILMQEGAKLLIQTLKQLTDGTLVEIPQSPTAETKHAPKITKETCAINWTHPGKQIHNQIRGLSPSPTAFTYLHGKLFKIYEARFIAEKHQKNPGDLDSDKKNHLRFAVSDGWIDALDVQLEGKSRMNIKDFLRGYPFPSPSA